MFPLFPPSPMLDFLPTLEGTAIPSEYTSIPLSLPLFQDSHDLSKLLKSWDVQRAKEEPPPVWTQEDRLRKSAQDLVDTERDYVRVSSHMNVYTYTHCSEALATISPPSHANTASEANVVPPPPPPPSLSLSLSLQLLHVLVETYLEPLQSEPFISPADVCNVIKVYNCTHCQIPSSSERDPGRQCCGDS